MQFGVRTGREPGPPGWWLHRHGSLTDPLRFAVLADFPYPPVFSIHHLPQEVVMKKRTTHRSVSGTKLYAVRDSKGRFLDIQTYKRAHGADLKRKAKKERKK